MSTEQFIANIEMTDFGRFYNVTFGHYRLDDTPGVWKEYYAPGRYDTATDRVTYGPVMVGDEGVRLEKPATFRLSPVEYAALLAALKRYNEYTSQGTRVEDVLASELQKERARVDKILDRMLPE